MLREQCVVLSARYVDKTHSIAQRPYFLQRCEQFLHFVRHRVELVNLVRENPSATVCFSPPPKTFFNVEGV